MSSKRINQLIIVSIIGFALFTFSFSAANAQSETINWNGWNFQYEIGTNLDGLAIKNVTFQGKQVMGRGAFPAMPVYYSNGCGPYLDRLDDDVVAVPWANNDTVVSRSFTQNGEEWYELGIREFIGQYDIYQVWYFNANGIIDAHLFSRGLQCSVYHEHWPHWRFDIDIAGPQNDQILRETNAGLEAYQTEFNVQANQAVNHGWVVQDTVTGDAVRLDFDSGAWNVDGTIVPETAYAKNRVAGRLQRNSEISWHTSGHSSLPSSWNDGANRIGYGNNENIDNKDVVVWYSGYLPHAASDGASLWHSTGVRLTVQRAGFSVENPGAQSSLVGDSVNLALAGYSSSGSITYSESGLPDGLNLDSSTGLITGALTQTSVGSTQVNISAVDGNGESDNYSFTWNVYPQGTLTEYDFESNQGWTTNPLNTDTATTGQWERANPEQTGGDVIMQLGTTAEGQNALVTEGTAGSSVGTNDIDSGVTSIRSPNITLPDTEGTLLSFAYYFAHFDNATADDFFRVSAIGSTTTVLFEQLGTAQDRGASWTTVRTELNDYAGQTIYLLIEAADGGGGSLVEAAVDDLKIRVLPINQPPTLAAPNNQTSILGDTVTLSLTANDPDGDTLTYSEIGLPTALSLNSSSGVISGPVTELGTFSVTVSVDDGNGGTDSASFSWAVNPVPNQPPVLTDPGDQTNIVGDTVTLTVSANDPDDDILAFGAGGLPAGLSINTTTGEISGTVTAEGSFSVTVSVDDGNDGTDTASFSWVVEPIPTMLGDVTCDDNVNAIDAMAILQWTVELRTAVQSCPLVGTAATTLNNSVADVDASGTVDAIDALLIVQCEVEIPNVLCPE